MECLQQERNVAASARHDKGAEDSQIENYNLSLPISLNDSFEDFQQQQELLGSLTNFLSSHTNLNTSIDFNKSASTTRNSSISHFLQRYKLMNRRHPYLLNSERANHLMRQSHQAPPLPKPLPEQNIISNQISFIEDPPFDKQPHQNQFQLLKKQDLEIISKLTKSQDFQHYKELMKMRSMHVGW